MRNIIYLQSNFSLKFAQQIFFWHLMRFIGDTVRLILRHGIIFFSLPLSSPYQYSSLISSVLFSPFNSYFLKSTFTSDKYIWAWKRESDEWKQKGKRRIKRAGFVMTYLKKGQFFVEIFSRHAKRDLGSLFPDSF